MLCAGQWVSIPATRVRYICKNHEKPQGIRCRACAFRLFCFFHYSIRVVFCLSSAQNTRFSLRRPPYSAGWNLHKNRGSAQTVQKISKNFKKFQKYEISSRFVSSYTNSQLKCLTERIRFFVLTKPSEVRRTGGTLNGTRQSQSEKDGARIKPF